MNNEIKFIKYIELIKYSRSSFNPNKAKQNNILAMNRPAPACTLSQPLCVGAAPYDYHYASL